MSDLTLEEEYAILKENGGTLATWEDFSRDWEEVVLYRYHQSLEASQREYNSAKAVGSRLLNYTTLAINGCITVGCPLYAPVGVLMQIIVYKLSELND